jgi:serine/alanine adding enzyme
MDVRVEQLPSIGNQAWDEYVHAHPRSTLYHLSGWRNVIEKTYGHRTYYLMATEDKPGLMVRNDKKTKGYELSPMRHELNANSVVGILPLVHIKHFLFGNSLISMPFLDYGGILANDQNSEKALLLHAIGLARDLGARRIELRQIRPLSWLNAIGSLYPENPHTSIDWTVQDRATACVTKTHKVRMVLEVPVSSHELMNSFKSKLRSQIQKPLKEGLKQKVGDLELLNDFYRVFSAHMRDLGSPVHSKELMKNILLEFRERSKVVVIYKDGYPIATSMIIGFRDTLENPWASALRKHRKLNPNMLLYWTMLEYTCNGGYNYFDFGRSSINEGTYRFKEQWGSEPIPLHWHYISLGGQPVDPEKSEKSRFETAIEIWQKLPVSITKIIGPRIRKYIGL